MAELKYTGKVVVVTGAGGGLGRAYAIAFAERGACVVVNDLGGDMKGGGKSTRAADVVVEEIKAKNGVAVANYDSVENGENIIKTAIENFGRIDILINNAGILRDKSFLRTSNDDWDIIHRIHLRSSFLLTRAAWPFMQKNKFGRIIMTSSAAGIYGNFGQANYSAAKLGLFGLSNTLSIEGDKYNIKCNTIAPLAKSRLTETVMPDEILDYLKPEYVAPLVLFLCHESCNETGSLFEVGGGWIGKLRWQKSTGKVLINHNKSVITVEDVRDNWTEIVSFDKPLYHATTSESANYALSQINQGDNKPIASKLNDDVFYYTQKDAILYALSLNMSTVNNLNYLYENHENFSVFPAYATIPAHEILDRLLLSFTLPKGVVIDLTKRVHGEHYLELYKQLPPTAAIHRNIKLLNVLDKGSGASLIFNVESFDDKNELISLNQFVIFLIGSGKFGGKRDCDYFKPSTKKFDRLPDATIEEKISVDQGALYRLNGDLNPQHIDPEYALRGGFKHPILHGLCTFGIATKHVLSLYCDNDAKCFKAIKVRFTNPVVPGDTIRTNTWLEKENNLFRVYFECKIVESNTPVITGAYADLFNIKCVQNSNSKL